jgi:hypothetical protein
LDDGPPRTPKNGQPLSLQAKVKVGTAMVSTLNGLERLANGVALRVYDLTTVRKMGATIVGGRTPTVPIPRDAGARPPRRVMDKETMTMTFHEEEDVA